MSKQLLTAYMVDGLPSQWLGTNAVPPNPVTIAQIWGWLKPKGNLGQGETAALKRLVARSSFFHISVVPVLGNISAALGNLGNESYPKFEVFPGQECVVLKTHSKFLFWRITLAKIFFIWKSDKEIVLRPVGLIPWILSIPQRVRNKIGKK